MASPYPLSDLIWLAEKHAEPLNTPESRAALGKRLRDAAASIRNDEVRTQYLSHYNGLLDDFYASLKPSEKAIGGKHVYGWRGVPPEMLAIGKQGIDQAVYVRVVLLGLRKFPELIAQNAEALGLLWVRDRGLAQVRETMLAAALEHYPLTSDVLENVLLKEGLRPTLLRMRRPFELAFSFLHNTADDVRACRDLAAVLEKLTSGIDIEAALKRAYQTLAGAAGPDRDDALREIERLHARARLVEEDFQAFWHEQAQPVGV